MITPRSHRRTPRRLFAGALAVLLIASGCLGDDSDEATSITTPEDPGVVPEDHGLSDARVAEVLPSTVAVSGVACGQLAAGSGFAIGDDLIVTNAHVILGIDEIRVDTFDGRELAASAIAFDPDADLAILEVPDAGLVPLSLASDTAEGTTGLIAGWEPAPFPDPIPFRIDRPVTVRIETVGGDARVDRKSWLLAADVAAGDSGAALVDRNGDVVGVAFAASRDAAGVAYAVRASEVDALISRGFDANLVIPDC